MSHAVKYIADKNEFEREKNFMKYLNDKFGEKQDLFLGMKLLTDKEEKYWDEQNMIFYELGLCSLEDAT